MRALFCVLLAGLLNLCLSGFAVAQVSDQAIAESVLGPQWKQLSRRAGMIFAGTVLSAPARSETVQNVSTERLVRGTTPAIELSFRVDEAIAGVEQGQVLTIREWVGAWSMHRPMSRGQHVLIFLYPPSQLGLTSPVGGLQGQVALDATGKNVSNHQLWPTAMIGPGKQGSRNESSAQGFHVDTTGSSVAQLERAIRRARQE
jgi:hypothetical protein